MSGPAVSSQDRPKPQAVVFDLGAVLIDWDPRHLYRKIFPGDAATMEWFLAEVCPAAWNVEQDRGRSWDVAIAEATARHPAHAAAIAAYRARWHEMAPAAIAGSVAVLERLDAAGVPLYAITNWAADTFAECRPRFPFLSRFRHIVVSGELGLLKPDPAIYHALATASGLDLRTCVFIDDSPKNVAGAEAVGMTGLLFTTPSRAAVDLRQLGFPA